MAITRTAMVDDDGSGTTGTILNNAWKQELYNQIDAFAAATQANPQTTVIRYGAAAGPYAFQDPLGNDMQIPNGAISPVWYLAPTIPSNVSGFLAEPNLTEHILINTTGNGITFHTQNASSSAANRLICPGYATFTLGAWGTVRILYSGAYSAWIVLAPKA